MSERQSSHALPPHGEPVTCKALFIAAMASGQGKTTVTAALARYFRERGERVQVFKCGPDFLDPMILQQASGSPVYQLDLWMSNDSHCRDLLYRAAQRNDIILIEGAMGLHDGDNSSAKLASLFDIPLMLLIDASAMAQTFGAIAFGLAHYKDGLKVAGVFANRVASASHYEMLAESLPPGLPMIGWMEKAASAELPRRHLGLVQAAEQNDMAQRLDAAKNALHGVDEFFLEACEFVPVSIAQDISDENKINDKSTEQRLHNKRIAIAHDKAFAFVYPANLDFLREHGAQIIFFSPLTDSDLPDCDAIYIPGGYPELYLQSLSQNKAIQSAIRDRVAQGIPLFAECGGMLYLLDELSDCDGNSTTMLGLLKGKARMQDKLAHLGLHQIDLYGGALRGHSYHYSLAEIDESVVAQSKPARRSRKSEAFYQKGSLRASYLHLYFASCPDAAMNLFLPVQDTLSEKPVLSEMSQH